MLCVIMRQLVFQYTSSTLLCPQFAAWVDAVVFVFSLEDEISFQTVYNYFLRLSSYRNTAEVPMVLVGTQGVCPTSDINSIKYSYCVYTEIQTYTELILLLSVFCVARYAVPHFCVEWSFALSKTLKSINETHCGSD